MSDLTLNLDKKAEQSIDKLRAHYKVNSRAEVIRKALALLQFAAKVDATHGELFARKDDKETKIIVR